MSVSLPSLRERMAIPAMHETLFEPAAEPASSEPVIKHAWCQMCGPAKFACSTRCTVENGRWTHVEGNPLANNNGTKGSRSLCTKGIVAMQAMYNPNRLMYPLKRVGAKGEGKFVRCTWDEALSEIGAKLKETKEKYGPESYAVLSPQAFQVLWSLGRRFLNVHGSPNYLHSGICALQRGASRKITIGAGMTEAKQIGKTKLLVNWGSNPENACINQGKVTKYLDAQKKGMKIIDIRPMMDQLSAKADIWVPVRPGTDTALALAILHVIIGEGLYDHDFVENWCSGFDKLAEHVKQFPPSWAAPITGVREEMIYEVARLMGTTSPMSIPFGNGVGDQQNDGNAIGCCISIIEAITGNLGIPGGGGCPAPQPKPMFKTNGIDRLTDRLVASEADIANGYYAGMSALVAPETPRWYQHPKVWESGPNSAYFKALMSVLTEEPYPIRFLLGQASNPLSASRQPKKVAEALKKLEFYVVVDIVWNPSCLYADFVLPAALDYETSHQFSVKNRADGTFIAINQKINEPLGESISDWEFYLKMGCAAGYADDFWNGDMDACLREQLDGSGITLEELRAAPEGILVPRPADDVAPEQPKPNYAKMFSVIPEGKVQCFNSWLAGKPNCRETGTLSGLPEYAGPPESLTNTPELAKEYPLIFSDVHAFRLCTHGYYADAPMLRDKQPYPWVRMNPKTAEKYGVAAGDWVKVESIHGSVNLVVELFEGMADEVLMARRGWWQSCEALGLDGYGFGDGGAETSVLYDSEFDNFDAFHSAMAKQTLVRIEKIDAPASSFEGHQWPAQPGPAPHEVAPARTASLVEEPAVETFRIVFDPDRCIKCWACEFGCKQWNNKATLSPARRRVYELPEGDYMETTRRFVSVACQQCKSGACITACPAGAIRRDENGIIAIDKRRCIHCGMCELSCPVGAPRVTRLGMDKCDMCASAGVPYGTDPHCVATCPTKALTLVSDKDAIKQNITFLKSAEAERVQRATSAGRIS